MALSKSWTVAQGVTLPNAYFKISHVDIITGVDGAYKASIQLRGYADKATRDADWSNFFYEQRFLISVTDFPTWFSSTAMTGKNHIEQCYEYLKSLPEFSDAVNA